MDAWAGRQCGSRNATFADIGGYPKRRTRRTVRQSSVARRCGTRVALTAGHVKHGSRLGAAARRRRRGTDDFYTTAADTCSTVFLPGAKAIKATPITTSTAEPMSSPRAIRLAKACPAISIAWTKLDHAVNAIKLRFSDGLRAASSRKMPSVT